MLFEAQFSSLADSGRPFSKCGKCLRYMKYISTKPPRLYCNTCEEVYDLPQKGTIKVISEGACYIPILTLCNAQLSPFCIISLNILIIFNSPYCIYDIIFPWFIFITHWESTASLYIIHLIYSSWWKISAFSLYLSKTLGKKEGWGGDIMLQRFTRWVWVMPNLVECEVTYFLLLSF